MRTIDHGVEFVQSTNDNKTPFIMLPDATGSPEQLRLLGKALNRPIFYVRDGRLLSNAKVEKSIDLDELADTYCEAIKHTLQKNNYEAKAPFVLVGYSGGGILANRIQQRFIHGNILVVYIDSVSPDTVRKMKPKAFAGHLIKVAGDIQEKFKQAKLNFSSLPNNFSELPLEQQIDAMWNIKFRSGDISQINDLDRCIKVMLSNHLTYLQYKKSLAPISVGSKVFVTQETINQFQDCLTNGHTILLGYDNNEAVPVKITKITAQGINHFNVTTEKESIGTIFRELVGNENEENYSNDEKISTQITILRFLEELEQIKPCWPMIMRNPDLGNMLFSVVTRLFHMDSLSPCNFDHFHPSRLLRNDVVVESSINMPKTLGVFGDFSENLFSKKRQPRSSTTDTHYLNGYSQK